MLNRIRLRDDDTLEERIEKIADRLNDVIIYLKNIDKLLVNSAPAVELKATEKAVRDLFYIRYNQKIRQLTGSFVNADGKKVWPTWSGKEGNLLKIDIAQHGKNTMIRNIELFFADQVHAVAQFTRYGKEAGYGYAVFHSMIGKLEACNAKVKPPCPKCGGWKTHYKECTELYVAVTEKVNERKELERIRDENANIDLTAMMREKQQQHKGTA